MNGPRSHGLPSRKSLLFEYGKLPMALSARWEAEDILKIVFPPHLQEVQYGIATKLIDHLKEVGEMDGHDISKWQKENGAANATLRNLVIPKLVRCGFLSRERRNPSGQDALDKRHKMVLTLSTRFGEALQHIGKEWNSLVGTWKVKRQQKEGET